MTAPEQAKAIYDSMKGFRVKNTHRKKCALVDIRDQIKLIEDLAKNMYSVLGTDSYEERCFMHDKKEHLKKVEQEIEKL